MNLFQYPMPRITLGMLVGCLIGSQISSLFFYVSSSLLLVVVLFFFYVRRRNKRLIGLILFLLACSLGVVSAWVHRETHYSQHYLTYCTPGKQHQIQVVVREQLKSTAQANRYVVLVQTVDRHPCFGKLLLSCPNTARTNRLAVGWAVQFPCRIRKNEKPLNPAAFDYGNYLNHKSIYAQCWVPLEQIQAQKKKKIDGYSLADSCRERIQSNLEKSGCEPVAAAVFKALLLGQQQDIPDQITQAYQYAGVVHILSVSGLHVGFIILMLRGIFRLFPKKRHFQILELVLSFLFLWAFALIAGLSPSVLRAVTVFSFVRLGQFLDRSNHNLNALFISAFLLLIVLPEAIFDIGFQLSYAALLFIFLLHPHLQKVVHPNTKVGRFMWENCTVSLAAQLGTLPISLYYFHQFPGLFLVANLLLLPFLTYLMGLGILCLVWLVFAVPPKSLIWLLEQSITWMNQLIDWLASFDFFVFRDIPCSSGMVIMGYVVLFAWVYVMSKPKFTTWLQMGIAILGLQLTILWPIWTAKQEQELLVFHCNRYTALVERRGNQVTAYTDLPPDKRRALHAYATAHFCSSLQLKKIPTAGHLPGQRIFLLSEANPLKAIPKNSIVLLRKSPKINLDLLLATQHPRYIIADGSNYKSFIRRWKASCMQAKIPFHATGEKGFYRLY